MDQTFAQLPDENVNGTLSHYYLCMHLTLTMERLLYIHCKHVNITYN